MKITHSDWTIETEGWVIDQSEECITLNPADVDAALQIATYRKRVGPVTSEELLEFARRDLSDSDAEPSPVHCGEFTGYSGECVAEGTFWRRWWLARGATHLFITYNTAADERETHRAVVDWMLSTLGAV